MRAHFGTKVLAVHGQRLLTTFHRPEGPQGRRFPAVLFLHGFPGAEKSVDVQRELMGRGVATVAPHFLGAWGSGGTYRFTTLVAQARAVLRAMRRMDFVDPRRVALYGFSMGGWTALNLSALEPALKAVVAVAPVGGPEMIQPGTKDRLARLALPLRAPRPEPLFRDFERAVTEQDPGLAVRRRVMPLLIVHGDQDELVPLAVSRRLVQLAPRPAALHVERGAPHDFLDRREKLARNVAAWLAERV